MSAVAKRPRKKPAVATEAPVPESAVAPAREVHGVHHGELEVSTPSAAAVVTRETHPHYWWPEKLPPGARNRLEQQLGRGGVDAHGRPTRWLSTRPTYPCPACDRIATDAGRQAVVARFTKGTIVYLECRACGHGGDGSWKMPRA